MAIDLSISKRLFRDFGRERTWLPQQRGIPPEKQRQYHERQSKPNRQPDESAAEGFFSATAVPQSAQHQGKKQADKPVAEVKRDALEREDRRAPTGFGQ